MLITDEEDLSNVRDSLGIDKEVLLILQEEDDVLSCADVLLDSIIVTENQVILHSQAGKWLEFKLRNIMVNKKGEIEMDYFVTSGFDDDDDDDDDFDFDDDDDDDFDFDEDDNDDFDFDEDDDDEGIYYLCLKMESKDVEMVITRMINTDEEDFDEVKGEYDTLVGLIKKRIVSIFDIGLKSKSKNTNKTSEKSAEKFKQTNTSEKSSSTSKINSMVWVCQCGTSNETNYCGNCGAQKPVEWKCSCGTLTSGFYCARCGAQRPVDWYCVCGKKNFGLFCSSCGVNKNDVWQCSCGRINNKAFCPKCGNKKDRN